MKPDMQVVFVCSGNTCRSQLAEALMLRLFPMVTVSSGGVRATQGKPTSAHAITLLQELGIDWHGVSKPVALPEAKNTLFLGMTQEHVDWLHQYYGQYRKDSVTIERLNPSKDIEDPFEGELEDYQVAMHEIGKALHERFSHRRSSR